MPINNDAEDNNNNNKDKAFKMGDSAEWLGLLPPGMSLGEIRAEQAKSLGEMLDNMRAIKGRNYVSLLLTAVNHFNLQGNTIQLLGWKEEVAEKLSDRSEETLLFSFALMSDVLYPGKDQDFLGRVVNDMMTDFRQLVEVGYKVSGVKE